MSPLLSEKQNSNILPVLHITSSCINFQKGVLPKLNKDKFLFRIRGHRGYDHMVVGFTTTYVISAYHHYKVVSSNPAHGKVYSIQHNKTGILSKLNI
jgi:hypothetical protein